MKLKTAVLCAGILCLSSGLALAAADAEIRVGPDSTVDTSTGTLTVKSVNAPRDGFLVVYTVDDGKPAEPIGHAEIKQGDNPNVAVILDETPKSGDRLALILHDDTGRTGEYEFGVNGSQEDPPTLADGQVVMATVTVE